MKLSRTGIVCLLLTACLAAGCESSVESSSSDSMSPSIPVEFALDGVVWKQETSLTDTDQAALVRFFQEHPSLAEGPLVEGEPLVFSASRSHRRFYWVESGHSDEPQWLMIELQNRRMSFEQGTGPPFPE